MKTALLELAHSCETEEPHALLDAAIHAAVFGAMDLVDALPAYTTSLDAAVTLVPEGVCWAIKHLPPNPPRANVWSRDFGIEENAGGTTMALALCAAALRARAEALP